MGKRVGFYLTDVQTKELKKASTKTGLTISEIIRRSIDEWLRTYNSKLKRDINTSIDRIEKRLDEIEAQLVSHRATLRREI